MTPNLPPIVAVDGFAYRSLVKAVARHIKYNEAYFKAKTDLPRRKLQAEMADGMVLAWARHLTGQEITFE